MLGVSRTAIYELVKDGQLHLVKIGGRSLVATEEIDALVGRLRAEAAVRPTADVRS